MTLRFPSLRQLGRPVLTGAGALVLALTVAPAIAQADQGSIPIDMQAYVSEVPQDPHNNDTAAVHISAGGGKETAQAYFRFNFNYLPEGATLDSVSVTLVKTAPTAAGAPDPNNFNNSGAILEACVLTEAIPAGMASNHAPLGHDCSASRTGTWQPDGSYKIDLKPLASKWLAGPNYGAVLFPIAASPSDTYEVAFDKGKASTAVTYTPTAPSSQTTTQPAPQTTTEPAPAPAGGGVVAPAPGSTGFDLGAPTPAAIQPAATPAPVIHHQKPATQAGAPASNGTSGWPLWAVALAVAVAASVGLLAYPLAQALSPAAGGLRTGLMSQLRLHPRLFAVTGVLVAYSGTFGSYSLAHGNSGLNPGRSGQVAVAPTDEPSASPSADASAAPGATPTPSAGGTVGGTAVGPSTQRSINGTTVYVPNNGGPPVANLFPASEDRIGITANQIKLCGHAALTYANAFQTTAADFNVFWSNVNDHGGINGRQVAMDYQNDDYKPDTAVKAAQTCKDEGIFMLLGGIGFDQIPAVRIWAENNRMLYMHHIATAKDADHLKYSFAPLPTVEEVGRMFGDLYLRKYSGKKVGILHRGSIYWDPGWKAFHARLAEAGMESKIVSESAVNQNQGSYANELLDAKGKGAEVMWAWENALDTPEMIKQAKGQQWSPNWMVFPFNVELTTLKGTDDATNPPLDGLAAWPAYTKGQYDGPFASYAADIHEFENEYAHYRSGTDLGGAGGDLLFLNWVAQKQLYQLLLDCGQDCTRNKVAGMLLTGYKKTVSPNCPEDWSRVSHRGGFALDVFTVLKDSGGNPYWAPVARCRERY